jgi:gliding motility-associated-like protein
MRIFAALLEKNFNFIRYFCFDKINLTMKKFKLLLVTGSLIVAGLFAGSASASHTAGMELFYRHISGKTYEFTLTFFRNCSGFTATAPTSFQIGAKSASLGINMNNALTVNLVPPTGTQPANLYNCTQSSLCYEEYVYRGTLNLSTLSATPQARDWIFFTSLCCRPGGAAAPDNIQAGSQYIECGMNNFDFPDGNNSAFFHNSKPNFPGFLNDYVINYLMRTMCVGNYYTFDQSVREYDGDQIRYEFNTPKDVGGVPETYINGYTFGNPFPHAPVPGLTIDSNGIIEVIPTLPPVGHDVFVIGIRAREFRTINVVIGGVLTSVSKEIGFVTRDMTLFIDNVNTCRYDYVHPYVNPVPCGIDSITVKFRPKVGEKSRVRCESLSPDGSEFRLVDRSVSPERYIGINAASWVCGSGQNTEEVKLKLAESLKYNGDYHLILKTGTDLDVIESECGFLETEFTETPITIVGGLPVDLDLPPVISVCLPQVDPFPLLKATSAKADRFDWTFNGDTIIGQDIDSMWANEAGTYTVLVRGPYGCPGADSVKVFFPEYKEVVFDVAPYCDSTFGKPDPTNLPKILTVPAEPTGGAWHWEYDFGPPNGYDKIKDGDSVNTIGPGNYKLVFTDDPVAPGVPGCVTEVPFAFNRENYPPEAPLNVQIDGDPVICNEEGGIGASLMVIEELLKPNFKAKPGYGPNTPYQYQWFLDNTNNPVGGANDEGILLTEERTYYVKVRDQYGCVGVAAVEVLRIGKQPAFEVFCEVLGGKRGKFYWNPVPFASSYLVSTDNGVNWIEVQQAYYEVNDIRLIGEVMVKAIMPNACKESDISFSKPCAAEVFPPNVFTPNKDGLNDVFFVGSLDLFPGSTATIFDRWGTTVFESSDYKNDWDGGDAPEGTYYYVINVADPAETVYKGVVTLLR